MPYLERYFKERLQPFLEIEDLRKILLTLGNYALRYKDYSACIEYFETYLFLLDNIDRIKMYRNFDPELNKGISKDRSQPTKRQKVIMTIDLNTKYTEVTNQLLEACIGNYEYEKSLNYINNLLFLYNNTIKMIHEDDPWYYPSKKPNDIILMDKEKYKENVKNKKIY